MVNKKWIAVTLVCVLALVQAQMVFGERDNPYELKFIECFANSDLTGMEQAIRDGGYRIDLSALLGSVLANYCWLEGGGYDILGKHPEKIITKNKRLALPAVRMLVEAGVDASEKAVWNTYRYVRDNSSFVLDNGVIYPTSGWAISAKLDVEIYNLLMDAGADPHVFGMYAIREDNIALLRSAIAHGMNVNTKWGQHFGNIYLPLTAATNLGKYAIVKLLVEAGAKVNQKDDEYSGKTAAEVAKEKGETDIYNYLIAHGAVDPNAPKVAQSSPSYYGSSGDNYSYSAPAPAQQSAPAPSRNTGAEIVQNLQKAFESPLDSGTYKMSGGSVELRFAGIAKSGVVSHKDASGTTSNGSYSIDGSRLQINVLGKTWFYTINSKTSFSGHGETWYRSGY